MIDHRELESRLQRLRGSRPYDEARREAAMAIELTAAGHGSALMRCGVAWISARYVVEILGLADLVDEPDPAEPADEPNPAEPADEPNPAEPADERDPAEPADDPLSLSPPRYAGIQ
jgi:hypothetical protein